MRSFINSARHFNSIAKSLKLLATGSEFDFPKSIESAYPIIYNYRQHSEEQVYNAIDSVVDTLRGLNVLTVSLQYKDQHNGRLDEHIQSQSYIVRNPKEEGLTLNKAGLMKALQCVEHQIETKHLKDLNDLTAAEENALLFLKEMVKALALDIVMAGDEGRISKADLLAYKQHLLTSNKSLNIETVAAVMEMVKASDEYKRETWAID